MIEISSNSGKYALAMLLVMSSKAVNLEEPSVTLVPADVLSNSNKQNNCCW
jgi:DNA polymerase-3 subunit beta